MALTPYRCVVVAVCQGGCAECSTSATYCTKCNDLGKHVDSGACVGMWLYCVCMHDMMCSCALRMFVVLVEEWSSHLLDCPCHECAHIVLLLAQITRARLPRPMVTWQLHASTLLTVTCHVAVVILECPL